MFHEKRSQQFLWLLRKNDSLRTRPWYINLLFTKYTLPQNSDPNVPSSDTEIPGSGSQTMLAFWIGIFANIDVSCPGTVTQESIHVWPWFGGLKAKPFPPHICFSLLTHQFRQPQVWDFPILNHSQPTGVDVWQIQRRVTLTAHTQWGQMPLRPQSHKTVPTSVSIDPSSRSSVIRLAN